MTQLLDQHGQPIPASLTRKTPTMGADVMGMRPALSEHPALGGLNPALVGELLANAERGNSRDWQAFCELIEERDLHYLGVLNTRKLAVSQLPVTIEDAGPSPAQRKHGDYVRAWLKRGIWQRAAFDILDAIGKGFSVHEMVWHCEAGNYYPERLLYRPQRWFEVSYQDGETIGLRSLNDSTTPDIDGAVAEAMTRPLDPMRTLVHRHSSWSGLTIRAGLTRAIAFNSLFKLFTNRDWGVFVQAYGIPIRIGKYGPDATPSDRNTLWRALMDISGSMSCMIPNTMMMDFVEPKNGAGSNDTHEKRAKWLDEQTSKAVLGQTGTTDARQGTHAAAATHRLVQEDIERADAMRLAHTLNEQIIRLMIDLSFGPPKDGNYPVATIGRPDETPIETVITAVQQLGPQGFKAKADELYTRLDLTPPNEGDAVVGLTAQPETPQPARDQPPEDKPARTSPSHIPAPTDKQPPQDAQSQQTLHAAPSQARDEKSRMVDALSDALAQNAQGPLTRMNSAVANAVTQARSYTDLEQRLRALKLDGRAFAEAMAAGIAAGHLAGHASMMATMHAKRGETPHDV